DLSALTILRNLHRCGTLNTAGSRARALPYSCMRAAFMSASFPALVRKVASPDVDGRQRSVRGDDHHLLVDKFLDAEFEKFAPVARTLYAAKRKLGRGGCPRGQIAGAPPPQGSAERRLSDV